MPPQKKKPSTQVAELAARLTEAAEAYYNSDTLLMSDAEYDAALETLRSLDPKHPLLLKVGADEAGAVNLPYKMASLNKVHPESQGGGGAVRRWVQKQKERGATRMLITEKLDGLSCLFTSSEKNGSRLYLRGNGVKGMEIRDGGSIESIMKRGSNHEQCVLRGELILSEANTPEGSIGRSLVNGWIHRAARGERLAELRSIDFVAYQVLEPSGMTREQQVAWLKSKEYLLPRTTSVSVNVCTDIFLETVLKGWKSGSGIYPIDGIVVAPGNLASEVLGAGDDLQNPSDAVAFKMILEEQIRRTRVVDVLWSPSAQGYLIPRIQIEPVEISGARIQYCTGHNARTIVNGSIGPGAQIKLRRSGDVIPTLDSVLSACADGPALPKNTDEWEWVGDEKDAVHIRVKGDGGKDLVCKKLEHCLNTLGVMGVGPGLIELLVKGGLTSVKEVYDANEDTLCKILGPGRGKLVWKALRATSDTWTEADLLVASSLLPRGVGHRKMAVLFDGEGDPRKWVEVWSKREAPEGWTRASLDGLLRAMPGAIAWRTEMFSWVPWRCGGGGGGPASASAGSGTSPGGTAGSVVFTGCRDKALEGRMIAAGWEIGDAVSKKTTLLVVADGTDVEGEGSGKLKKARSMNIKIQNLTQIRELFP